MTIDYQTSKIYKISSSMHPGVYIGQTVKDISYKLNALVYEYKHFLNGKGLYNPVYDILSQGVYEIELIENFPCNSIQELKKRLRDIIIQYGDNCINKERVSRSINISLKTAMPIDTMLPCCVCNVFISAKSFRVHEQSINHKKALDVLEMK